MISLLQAEIASLLATSIGMSLPLMWLRQRVRIRQRNLRRAIPDVLDMMVLCLEGGVSLNAAIQRVMVELQAIHPALAGELSIIHREIQLGLSVGEALRAFAERTGIPVALTLLVDNAGTVSGLRIETDPKARLYVRKKAFLFGIQVKSRYGLDGWSCTQAQPSAGEQPIGGVYVRERCTKTTHERSLVVERNLFRRPDQDMKNFVDETRTTILRTKD